MNLIEQNYFILQQKIFKDLKMEELIKENLNHDLTISEDEKSMLLKIYSDIYQVKCKDCEFFRPNIHTDLEKYRKHLFNISDITSVIHRLLHHHHPEPCLLHGQLLPDNILVTSNGLFLPDNACYCGDRELDLAWLTTFCPNYDDFMQGYTETWPLPQGYETRQVIYALYPLLVQLHQDPALETRVHHHIALILAI